MSQRRRRSRHWGQLVLAVVALLNSTAAATAVTIGPPVQIATIVPPSLTTLPEISGLVDGRTNSNTFWVHNDSGDTARFFAINHQGSLLGTFPLAGAAAVDWEDIAIGPKPGGGNYLYLGDIGDNNLLRSSITVYRTDEPQSTAGATIPAGNYSSANLQYPGGRRNAESLFVDPLTSDVYIITKTSTPEIYSAPASAFSSSMTTMASLGNLGVPLATPTAADISPDGRHILVRSKTAGYLFERGTGQSIADALHGAGIPFTLGAEVQGEAIGWAADGTSFYTTSESDGTLSVPIHSYSFTVPAPPLAGDYNENHIVDAADYTVWRDLLGTSIALPNEDATPGVVTEEDYSVWKAHYGETVGGGAASIVQSNRVPANGVPEPASLVLLVFGAIGLLTVRKKRGSEPRIVKSNWPLHLF